MIPRDYEEPMSFWEWVRTFLLLLVPLLGVILLFVWAFSERGKTSRRNFARAYLALTLAVVVGVGLLAALSIPAFQHVRDLSRAKMAELEAKQAQPGSAEETPGGALPPAKPPTAPADEPLRSFRSTDGRTIEARVVSLTDDTVTIRRADGREFTTELTRFSPEDVEYFMRLRHGGGAFD